MYLGQFALPQRITPQPLQLCCVTEPMAKPLVTMNHLHSEVMKALQLQSGTDDQMILMIKACLIYPM